MSTSEKIRYLNDSARHSLSGCRVLITQGVRALNRFSEIIEIVRTFDNFSEDNDPHGERDFGSFTTAGELMFWKFDYYDNGLQVASLDPSDETITVRVLTIMLAIEY